LSNFLCETEFRIKVFAPLFSISAAKNAGGTADFCVAKALTSGRAWAVPRSLKYNEKHRKGEKNEK